MDFSRPGSETPFVLVSLCTKRSCGTEHACLPHPTINSQQAELASYEFLLP